MYWGFFPTEMFCSRTLMKCSIIVLSGAAGSYLPCMLTCALY